MEIKPLSCFELCLTDDNGNVLELPRCVGPCELDEYICICVETIMRA